MHKKPEGRVRKALSAAPSEALLTNSSSLYPGCRAKTLKLAHDPLVNRNPNQTNLAFAPEHETQTWSMRYSG